MSMSDIADNIKIYVDAHLWRNPVKGNLLRKAEKIRSTRN
jgi:hypothetical protein